jgi:hypothetical protein
VKPQLAILVAALSACATSESHRYHHTVAAEAASATPSAVATEARVGGSYQNSITCGQQHRYALDMAANQTVRATFRTTMTGSEPLGEDIAWRWLGPTDAALDTNALPVPEPNGAAREANFEARSTYAGRYTLVISVEEGAGCAHASYTLVLH